VWSQELRQNDDGFYARPETKRARTLKAPTSRPSSVGGELFKSEKREEKELLKLGEELLDDEGDTAPDKGDLESDLSDEGKEIA